MSADPLAFTVDRPKVLYRQITEQIRGLIVGGQLEPGTKLPSSEELAAKWNTHAGTIQSALTPLVKEGLLTRRPKVGTFVSKRRERLREIGIYYDSDIWLNQANAFKRAVHVELTRMLESEGIGLRVWFDPRTEKQRGKAWPTLMSAVERREVQAVIATDVPAQVVDWLQRLPVLTAYFTYAPVPNRVGLDFEQLAESSVAQLKRQGCRSAGIISILESEEGAATGSASTNENFYAHFIEVCRAQGIEVRDEWIRMAHEFVRDELQEEFGYKEFRQVWRNPHRPEGLVVFPDTSVPGVIMAALQERVDVPRELKIVAHKHAEINFLCPLPITFLYSSTRQVAHTLFSQIKRQFEGETCQPIMLPFRASARGFPSGG
jgi:DNA-binding transcriptional regulator YhcF (GntR family)